MGDFFGKMFAGAIFLGVLYLLSQVFEKAGFEILIIAAIVIGIYYFSKISEK